MFEPTKTELETALMALRSIIYQNELMMDYLDAVKNEIPNYVDLLKECDKCFESIQPAICWIKENIDIRNDADIKMQTQLNDLWLELNRYREKENDSEF